MVEGQYIVLSDTAATLTSSCTSDSSDSSVPAATLTSSYTSDSSEIMISAGESSGEIHGAALMEAARKKGFTWTFSGLGGDNMAAAGARLIGHVRDTSVMGLTEVLGSLGRILRIRRALKQALRERPPAALVLIDTPDFNFALARLATELNIPVIYYICPQVWAWREGRLKFLARYTRRRALLFSFEKKFYEERGVSADWVGHPLLDELPEPTPREVMKNTLGFPAKKKLLALLPGSRHKLVEKLVPSFLATADLLLEQHPGLELVLPRADTVNPDFLRQFTDKASARVRERLRILNGDSRRVLAAADLALIASGTSSVEATFLGTPQVVAYKVSKLTWLIGRRLVSVPFATIANLIGGREIVPEFLQHRATPENLAAACLPLLAGGVALARQCEDLGRVRAQLGEPGASGRVVDIIAQELGLERS